MLSGPVCKPLKPHGRLDSVIDGVRSTALIGGTATRTTNDKGQLRFLTLPPGRCVLVVEMPGFATLHEEIVIEVGKTIRTTVKLSLAGFAESIYRRRGHLAYGR